jgi:hypothetical protein
MLTSSPHRAGWHRPEWAGFEIARREACGFGFSHADAARVHAAPVLVLVLVLVFPTSFPSANP